MQNLMNFFVRSTRWARTWAFSRGDAGASLVEYALLLALVAVAAMGALALLGGSVSSTINHVNQQLGGTTTTTGG